jgi:hypothetical protein
MGVRFPSVFSNAFIGPLPASGAETICYTTSPISEPVDNAQVLIFWGFSYIPGTANTSATFTLRRGPLLTSPTFQAGLWTTTVVAGNAIITSGAYADSPGVVAGQQYTLTIQQGAATGAGTFRDGYLMAMVL